MRATERRCPEVQPHRRPRVLPRVVRRPLALDRFTEVFGGERPELERRVRVTLQRRMPRGVPAQPPGPLDAQAFEVVLQVVAHEESLVVVVVGGALGSVEHGEHGRSDLAQARRSDEGARVDAGEFGSVIGDWSVGCDERGEQHGSVRVHDADARAHGAAPVLLRAHHLAVESHRASSGVPPPRVILKSRCPFKRAAVRAPLGLDRQAPGASPRLVRGFAPRAGQLTGQVLPQGVQVGEVLAARAAQRVARRVPRLLPMLAQGVGILATLEAVRALIRDPRVRGGRTRRARCIVLAPARGRYESIPRRVRWRLHRSAFETGWRISGRVFVSRPSSSSSDRTLDETALGGRFPRLVSPG